MKPEIQGEANSSADSGGEKVQNKHPGLEKDVIEMASYEFSTSMAVSASRGDGGAATTGRGKLEPFKFTKNVDSSSMTLAFHAAAGTIFSLVHIRVYASLGDGGGKEHAPKQIVEMKLTGAVISACEISAGGGDELPTESITFNYGSIEMKCQSMIASAEDGQITFGPEKRFNWNTITNKGVKA
ncbi:MAG: type VI secretion system tube protein Hcp [Opitutaceae bacterium]|nr:type VI secretion system tube protein Hcp [Opitutaceae bacterium]